MPIFQNVAARLHAWLCPSDTVVFTARTSARIARPMIPAIQKMLADNRDGVTYRFSIGHWFRSPRPPLAYYLGTVSLCRIDGPSQDAPADYPNADYLPVGGLVETPGTTANLSPFEAADLHRRIKGAIEREIVTWTTEHRLQDIQPADLQCEHPNADRVAEVQIAGLRAGKRGQAND